MLNVNWLVNQVSIEYQSSVDQLSKMYQLSVEQASRADQGDQHSTMEPIILY